jgi:hypothetical protein
MLLAMLRGKDDRAGMVSIASAAHTSGELRAGEVDV